MHEYEFRIAPYIRRPRRTWKKIQDMVAERELSDIDEWADLPTFTCSGDVKLSDADIKALEEMPGVSVKEIISSEI